MRHWRHACQVAVSSLPLGVDVDLDAVEVAHALRVAAIQTTDVRTEWQLAASRAAALLCRFVNASCCTALALDERVVRWDLMGHSLDASRLSRLHTVMGRLGMSTVDASTGDDSIAFQCDAGRPAHV